MKFKGDTCEIADNARPQYINRQGKTKLFFTYSVEWKKSDVRWASRWDSYLAMSDVQIHWFSIINSVIVVFFLSGILTMIIIRTLRRDIAKCVNNFIAFLIYSKLTITLQHIGTIRMTSTTKRWKNRDGNLFTETFSVPRSTRNFLLLLLAVEFKFSAWLSSFFVILV